MPIRSILQRRKDIALAKQSAQIGHGLSTFRSLVPTRTPSPLPSPTISSFDIIGTAITWASLSLSQLSSNTDTTASSSVAARPLVCVKGTLAGHPAVFLIDSGATNDFISSHFIKKHSLHNKVTPSNRYIKGYDGQVKPAAGVLSTSVKYDSQLGRTIVSDITTSRPFLIADVEHHDAVLGLPWLESINPHTNWATGEVSVQHSGVKHILAHPRHTDSSSSSSSSAIVIDDSDEMPPLVTCSNYLRSMITEIFSAASVEDNSPSSLYEFLTRSSSFTNSPYDRQEEDDSPVTVTGPPLLGTLDPELIKCRASMLEANKDVFPDELPSGIPDDRGFYHAIELMPGSKPPARLHRRANMNPSPTMKAWIEEYLGKKFISHSHSQYASLGFEVSKKGTTEKRQVVDYRALNAITIKDRNPLPRTDVLMDQLSKAKYFSKIDLRSGFHQIAIRPEDRHKTAFLTPLGLFEYNVLPMGLCNSPATFQRLMNWVFSPMLNKYVIVYLDDIIVYSNTLDEHKLHLESVFKQLRAKKLYAKASKSSLFMQEIEFLGHYVGINGVRVMEDKVAAVSSWPIPKTVRDVRSFLGLAGFYRRFVKNYSSIALPLTQLTRVVTGGPFQWGPAQQTAFDAIKAALKAAPVLLLPDPDKQFVIHCDASGYAVGAVLQQDHGNGLQPVSFLSKKMNDAETRYPVHEQELLAIHTALQTWRHYLQPKHFIVRTDHKSLTYFQTQPMLSGRQVRWMEDLSDFEYTIEYVKGPTNIVADAFSRRVDHNDGTIPMDRPPLFVDKKSVVPVAAAANAIVASRQTGTELLSSSIFTTTPPSLSSSPPSTLSYAQAASSMRKSSLPSNLSPEEQELARTRAIESATKVLLPGSIPLPPVNSHGARHTPTQRCTATTKRGRQCGAKTCKGQYCWIHAQHIEGIRIKPSSIPSGGFGLWAARDLPIGTRPVIYSGDKMTTLHDSDGGPYALSITRNWAIDAARTNTAYGRWVNDPRGTGRRANVRFVVNPGKKTACLEVIRPIKKGDELFVSYGSEYWKHFGPKAKVVVRPAIVDPDEFAQLAEAQLSQLQSVEATGTKQVASSIAPELVQEFTQACLADSNYTSYVKDYRGRQPRGSPYRETHKCGETLYRVRGDCIIRVDTGALCVPNSPSLRTRLIRECHDTPIGGHFGRDKTLEALRPRFYWNGMYTDVEKYTLTCDECQRNKPSQQSTPGLSIPIIPPSEVCQTWTMDLITDLPTTPTGNDSIVVFVCKLSKLVHYLPCKKSISAPQLARLFLSHIVRQHGLPQSIISDRDPRFTAHFWRAFWSMLGTSLPMSTAYHPQTDGQTERANRTLEVILRSVVDFKQTNWDDCLPAAELAVNNAINASTGYSPFYLCYGREARLPIDSAIAPLMSKQVSDNPSAVEEVERWRTAIRHAHDNVVSAGQRQAYYSDKHKRDITYEPGEKVLLSTANLRLQGDAKRSRKLTSPYIGPFTIDRAINANAYKLTLPPTLKIHPVVNISHLKKYHDGAQLFPARPDPIQRPPPTTDGVDGSGAPEWEVEQILDKRLYRRKVQYLILWKGYPRHEATWEPLENLEHSAQLIEEYEAERLAMIQEVVAILDGSLKVTTAG